jgi:hypothetical protein
VQTCYQLPALQPGVAPVPLLAAYGPDNSVPYVPLGYSPPSYPQSVFTHMSPDGLSVPCRPWLVLYSTLASYSLSTSYR